jgi:hypothetical protein
MHRKLLAALLSGALFAAAALAQDPQKPAEKPAAEATQGPTSVPPPGPGQEPDPKIIGDLMDCLATGLTEDWKRAWMVIREADRDKTGNERICVGTFFYATDLNDRKGKKLQVCSHTKILEGIGKLNDYLPGNQQRWTAATFNFYRDGRFEASYDYTPPKPKAKPPAKPAAKKKQETAK